MLNTKSVLGSENWLRKLTWQQNPLYQESTWLPLREAPIAGETRSTFETLPVPPYGQCRIKMRHISIGAFLSCNILRSLNALLYISILQCTPAPIPACFIHHDERFILPEIREVGLHFLNCPQVLLIEQNLILVNENTILLMKVPSTSSFNIFS